MRDRQRQGEGNILLGGEKGTERQPGNGISDTNITQIPRYQDTGEAELQARSNTTTAAATVATTPSQIKKTKRKMMKRRRRTYYDQWLILSRKKKGGEKGELSDHKLLLMPLFSLLSPQLVSLDLNP